MEKKYGMLSCSDFLKDISLKKPVPGGGGAASLVGGIGVSLCAMVGNYTVNNKKFHENEKDMKGILKRAEKLQEQFLTLIDKDAISFAPLAEAYKIPKNDPNRIDIMEIALKNAYRVPYEIMECCCETIELLVEMEQKGNPMLISDVGVGLICCKAALKSAAFNVFINSSMLNNLEDKNHIEKLVNNMLEEYIKKSDDIIEKIERLWN